MKTRYIILTVSAILIAASIALGIFLILKSQDSGTPPDESGGESAHVTDLPNDESQDAPQAPDDNSSDNSPDNTEDTEACEHEFYEDRTVRPASCTAEGTVIDKCSLCQDEKERKLATLPHAEVTDLGFPATCLSSGLTEGNHCSVCGTVTSPQTVIPTLSHVKAVEKGYEATCTESGLSDYVYCGSCGSCLSASSEIPPLGHTEATEAGYKATCTEAGLTDKTYCSICNTVLKESEIIEPAHSVGSDGSCTACGKIFFTKGLKFAKISGKEQYRITGYTGSAKEVLIPSEYQGYTVTAIDEYAFEYCDITSATIPEGITEIGAYAFSNCSQLKEISLPKTLESIGEGAFMNCSSLEAVSLPDLSALPFQCFKGCSELSAVTLSQGLEAIGDEAFYGCVQLTSISIPEGVEQIGAKAFYNCKKLSEIYLPDEISDIGSGAFQYCSALTVVRYGGKAEDFEKISFANPYSDPRYYGGALYET